MAERMVAVCSHCLCASCWHGEHMCERSDSGGVVNVSVDELRKLDREHADNWAAAKMAAVYGESSHAHLRALAEDRPDVEPPPQGRDLVPLSALDRADIRRELEAREEALELDARLFRLTQRSYHAIELSARAARVRELIALLAVLLLATSCNEWPLGAPPHTVCLEASVSEADAAVWRAAETRWNVEIGEAVLLDETDGCDVRVRASTELGEPACTLPVDDHVRVFFVPARLAPCVALHELAHVLLGPGVHIAGTVLAEYGCDFPEVTAPVAERVKAKWGL